jgi:hypothetical protein
MITDGFDALTVWTASWRIKKTGSPKAPREVLTRGRQKVVPVVQSKPAMLLAGDPGSKSRPLDGLSGRVTVAGG